MSCSKASLVGEAVWVPYTPMHRISPGPIDTILFWPADPSMNSVQVINAAKKALATIHRGGEYQINSQAAITGIFGTILNAVGTGLTFVGGIALLVAGIGIMNIMLVSVSERTREIGIRKSIGASRLAILMQFLIEAIVLTLAGGALGIVAAYGMSYGVQRYTKIAPHFTPQAFLIALGISIGVGLIFGIAPAFKAARKKPIDALRYE